MGLHIEAQTASQIPFPVVTTYFKIAPLTEIITVPDANEVGRAQNLRPQNKDHQKSKALEQRKSTLKEKRIPK